ncbi:MAG: nucleotidyltransferase domain-containing protein [Sedimentisphaerales bacterium]
MVEMAEIREVAQKIGRQANAKSVILFGSYARGQATEHSDVDILVVAESSLPKHKRSRELYKLFKPYPFGMDIIVYTSAEIELARKSPLSFISTVLQDGKKIYG